MPLRVACCAQYLSRWPDDLSAVPRSVYNAHWFVKAIKGDKFPKPVTLRYGNGPAVTLRTGSQADAHRLFAQWAVPRVAGEVGKRAIIVPVPGSACAVGSEAIGTADRIAAALAVAAGGQLSVVHAIRMDEVLTPAHKNGPRFADEVFPHLRYVERVSSNVPVVLLDDVLTSGGHLRACRALLAQNGVNVSFAVCAGRTHQVSVPDPWNLEPEPLPDWPE